MDLTGTRPPVWRRLEISSAVFLDELHEILQTAFGWTDSHLHRFASGGTAFDVKAQFYLCPFDVEEGEDDGIPEEDVRLDEVLGEVGEKVHYAYDYGDGWEHVVRLEAVLDRPAGAQCREVHRRAPRRTAGGLRWCLGLRGARGGGGDRR